MSVAKLLLSGFLVASGLILGAFTLHAHFAPQWGGQATVPAARERAQRAAATHIPPDSWTPKLVRAAPASGAATVSEAAAAKARKRLAEKRLTAQRKEKAKEEEPQTVLPWLWSLLADNAK